MTEDERRARIRHHTYETCEGIQEHAERIVALEELALDMFERLRRENCIKCSIVALMDGVYMDADVVDCDDECCDLPEFYRRIDELGLGEMG